MAYCASCGTQMDDAARACPECGHRTGRRVTSGAPRRTEGSATASLVLGLAGLVVYPIVASILAITFGMQARTRIRQDPSLEGEGMAKAGVMLGWVGLALWWVIAAIAAFRLVMMLMFPGYALSGSGF